MIEQPDIDQLFNWLHKQYGPFEEIEHHSRGAYTQALRAQRIYREGQLKHGRRRLIAGIKLLPYVYAYRPPTALQFVGLCAETRSHADKARAIINGEPLDEG